MWLGIDFGTSNSSASRLVGGHPHAVREPVEQQPFFPSCVLLPPPDGKAEIRDRLVTGNGAEHQMLIYPDRFRAELKRNLGEPWPLLLGGEEVTVVDAVGSIMRSIKTEADRISGGPFPNAMLTVPVAFGSERVTLIETAARSAGFEKVDNCLEPVAAARYHLHVQQDQSLDDGLLLVYDFGGGTFDASLVRKTGSAYSIIASSGIEDCGGRDLDQELFNALLPRASPALRKRLAAAAGADAAGSPQAQALLRLRLMAFERCRRIKHELSVADYSVADFGDPPELIRFTRAEFEPLLEPHFARTVDCCERLVRGQGLEWKDVARVLLVGGTTRIPLIARSLKERFERPVLSVEDPELAVSFGAALALGAPQARNGGGKKTVPSTLQAAIDAAAAGATVHVGAGLYREALKIDKPLTIIGDSGRAIVDAADKPALTVSASGVRIEGLALHTQSGMSALNLQNAVAEVEACDIWGGKQACVWVAGGTVSLTNSRIHDGEAHGIHLADGGGRIAGNEITTNAKAGISIALRSGPLEISANRLSRNKSGIFVTEGDAELVISGNEAFANEVGIEIAYPRSAPMVRENQAHDNSKFGISVNWGAGGVVEHNQVARNAAIGIKLDAADTAPLVRHNTIDGGAAVGVSTSQADGIVIENQISGNDAVRVAANATTTFRRNEIRAAHRAVDAQDNAKALFEENLFLPTDPAATGVFMSVAAAPRLRRNVFKLGFAAYYRTMPATKVRPVTFVANQIALRDLTSEAFQPLAAFLERADWTAADNESIRLIRAAAGVQVIKTRESAAALPVPLLKEIDRLWRLATDSPLRKREWVNVTEKGVSAPSGWQIAFTSLATRLKELGL